MPVTVVALSTSTRSVPDVLFLGGLNSSAEALSSLISVL